MLFDLVITSLGIMAASLIGVFSIWKQAGDYISRNLHFLVSFAAGVFLVLAFNLSKEVLLHGPSIESGIMFILVGLIGINILLKIIPEGHHHHAEGDAHTHSKIDARRMLIGDSIHNIGDGILLASSFLISSTLGFATAVGIIIHELVQEISEFFVLRQAGYSPKRALEINFMTASTILIGSLGGYLFLQEFKQFEIPVLAIATGAILALLLQDLIPHSIKHARQKKCLHKHLLAVIVGALLMFGITSITSDTHTHDHARNVLSTISHV